MNRLINDIFSEYEKAGNFKAEFGRLGISEQSAMNERFYLGDQWHGVNFSSKMPSVQHNIIKRIGDYKMSVVSDIEPMIKFSVMGAETYNSLKLGSAAEEFLDSDKSLDDEQKKLIYVKALSKYFQNSSKNSGVETALYEAVRNAYITGTGIVYSYWDNEVNSGLFADNLKTMRILGDVRCMALDVDRVFFGDSFERDIEKQPYIIIKERMKVEDARNEALKFGLSEDESLKIVADSERYNSLCDREHSDDMVTVLTKLYKDFDENGIKTVFAVRITKNSIVRKPFSMRVRRYPISVFRWEENKNCVYGISEVTNIIPNQIAINRMLTAGVWATMLNGMPIMLVNNNVIGGKITNEPGQIISFNGDNDEFMNSVKYIDPPDFADNFSKSISMMIDDTLEICGASRAALGNYDFNNASAIENLQKATLVPLKRLKNKYERFVCDLALDFFEFFARCYGVRKIRIVDGECVYYLPFDSDLIEDLIVEAEIDYAAQSDLLKGELTDER